MKKRLCSQARIHDTMFHGDIPMCQKLYTYVEEQRSYGQDINPCLKTYNFDLEVKGPNHIEVMHVFDPWSNR